MERDKLEGITIELFAENIYKCEVIDRLHETKCEFLETRKTLGEKWFNDLKEKCKDLTDKELAKLEQKENYLFYMESTWEQIIKDECFRILKSTKSFYSVAKNPKFIQYIDNGRVLVYKLIKLILRQKTFAENITDDKYTVALLEESENGTIFINGKKFIIHT